MLGVRSVVYLGSLCFESQAFLSLIPVHEALEACGQVLDVPYGTRQEPDPITPRIKLWNGRCEAVSTARHKCGTVVIEHSV